MTIDQEKVIQKTIAFVKEVLADAEGGHDWWHIHRVWQLSKTIGASEKADMFIVGLGALLHDISDAKFNGGDETAGPRIARGFLMSLLLDDSVIEHVIRIIENISFRKSFEGASFNSIELQVIQDADRLDAIGAIGIARTFNYGGHKNREIYNPEIKPNLNMTKDEYRSNSAPTINHFYEKLLLLKSKMNTVTGRKLAEHRHQFMEKYLDEFFGEWSGKI